MPLAKTNYPVNAGSPGDITNDGVSEQFLPDKNFAFDPRVRVWTSRRQRSQELKQLHESDWLRYWDWYRNVQEPLDDPADWWRSNEVVPTPFKIIETILPRLVMGMFDSPDYFVVEARNARAELYEHMVFNLLKQLLEDMELFPKLYEALRYSCIMGHAWGKVVWREEYTERQVMIPFEMTNAEYLEQLAGLEAVKEAMDQFGPEELEAMSGQMGLEAHVQEDEVFNGPDFQWRTLDRIFPDPTGRDKWFIEEIDATLEELEEVQDELGVYDQDVLNMLTMEYGRQPQANTAEYGGLDSLGDARTGTSAGVSTEYMREPESTEGIPDWISTPMREGVGVKLWQCWGWVPSDMRGTDGSAWRLLVLADGKYVLRDEPSPTPDGKPPYFGIKSLAIPNRLFGESILKYIGPLADQQTRLANMRMDEVYLGVWQQYLFRKNAVVSDNALLMQPGGAIEVNPEPNQNIADTFQVLPRRDVLPSVWQEDIWRQQQAESAAAATETLQGTGSGDRTTATEIERNLQQGNARHVLQVMFTDYTVLKEIIQRSWQWSQMRMTSSKLVHMQGEDYVQVNLLDLQTPVDFVVGGGVFALSKDARVQMDMELIQFLTDPELRQWFKVGPILRKWMQDKGWKNPEGYLKTEEEKAYEDYQRGQAMAAQQMAMQENQQLAGQMGQPPVPGGGEMGQAGPPSGGPTPPNVPSVPTQGDQRSLDGGSGAPPSGNPTA